MLNQCPVSNNPNTTYSNQSLTSSVISPTTVLDDVKNYIIKRSNQNNPLTNILQFPCVLQNSTNETNYTNIVKLTESPFSIKFAPYYNAVPRIFPGLDFIAYDVTKSLRYMTYFGSNAVPSIFLLRKNRLLARLNSTKDIQTLISLIESTLLNSTLIRVNINPILFRLDMSKKDAVTITDVQPTTYRRWVIPTQYLVFGSLMAIGILNMTKGLFRFSFGFVGGLGFGIVAGFMFAESSVGQYLIYQRSKYSRS
ncbi:unnamed protein product [Didymodactylos carnosus]|uniref:Uncharacterized protein n=1 Tax=Didymodactylos carnosus TaxID=1234261 RepID=A0A813XRB6_9BILA|nr:unnamed protein product [Didymodactylos carnosus]CAF3657890.1 unnamed protein product [Didymodactylos carnosus]